MVADKKQVPVGSDRAVYHCEAVLGELGHLLAFPMAKAIHGVVVYHPRGLHVGVHDRGADKRKAALFSGPWPTYRKQGWTKAHRASIWAYSAEVPHPQSPRCSQRNYLALFVPRETRGHSCAHQIP